MISHLSTEIIIRSFDIRKDEGIAILRQGIIRRRGNRQTKAEGIIAKGVYYRSELKIHTASRQRPVVRESIFACSIKHFAVFAVTVDVHIINSYCKTEEITVFEVQAGIKVISLYATRHSFVVWAARSIINAVFVIALLVLRAGLVVKISLIPCVSKRRAFFGTTPERSHISHLPCLRRTA